MNLRRPWQRRRPEHRPLKKLSRPSRRLGIVRLGVEPLEDRSLLSALTLTPTTFADNDFGYVAGHTPKTLPRLHHRRQRQPGLDGAVERGHVHAQYFERRDRP